MLLAEPTMELPERYRVLRGQTLESSPHLFKGDSPVLLLALCLEVSQKIQLRLRRTGIRFDDDSGTVDPAARIL